MHFLSLLDQTGKLVSGILIDVIYVVPYHGLLYCDSRLCLSSKRMFNIDFRLPQRSVIYCQISALVGMNI